MGISAWRRSRIWRVARWPIAVLVGAFVVIQFVPYGWWHENPPVVRDAPWPDQASADIARTSCYSCHSNETDWPVYSYIAPMSWLVRSDVERARDQLNFSDWSSGDANDAADMILQGAMPPSRYTRIHADAKLTATEQDALLAALLQMSKEGDSGDNSGPGGGDGSGSDDSGSGD
jgi:Haem-binding domain